MRTYSIIEDTDLKRFEAKVNNRLADGWKTEGGVAIFEREEKYGEDEVRYVTTYAQAMREV